MTLRIANIVIVALIVLTVRSCIEATQHVQQIVTVSEEAIVSAMRYVWERMKIIIEPSAAVPLGALLDKKIDLTGKRIGIILSGGNVSLDHLPWIP